ncbi:CaiB/BaiF CoA transferase family protein [Nocardia brasiliensis]|uniref:CaiB/BaiF CoA transferase family protein n=1 Tax=Nocardia brasiliensis TaxID=37326 RepID=UPI003D8DA34D
MRVIESASLAAGGGVGMLLGDLGADVIKVESPDGGDVIRHFGQLAPGFSPAFLQLHRNKRSVTADLRTASGRQFFAALIASADVLIDGNRIGLLDRWGFSRDNLTQLNSRLVICEVNGFGSTGPYSPIPVHGLMMNALIGSPPHPNSQPKPKPNAAGALSAATTATAYIAAALYHRETTGRGTTLDVSGADALLQRDCLLASYQLNADRLTDPAAVTALFDGYLGPRYRCYETLDGREIAFTAIESSSWQRFCALTGHTELFSETSENRVIRALSLLFRAHNVEYWTHLATAHRLPIGPSYPQLIEAVADPHLQQRNAIVYSEHPAAGSYACIGATPLVDGRPFEIYRPAPALGEHNAEVRAELRLPESET